MIYLSVIHVFILKNVDDIVVTFLKNEILKFGKYYKFKVLKSDDWNYIIDIGSCRAIFAHNLFYTNNELGKLKIENIQQKHK